MKKIVNFRPFLLIAVCAITVILCSALLPDPYANIICIVIATALFLTAVTLGFDGKPIACVTIAIAFVVTASCFINIAVTRYNWNNEFNDDEKYFFVGTIESITLTTGGANYLLTDVTADGSTLSGNLRLLVDDDDVVTVQFLKCGDRISVNTDAQFSKFNPKRSSIIRNNIRYYAIVNASDISFLDTNPSFFVKFRNKISETLDKNLGEYNQIAFSMITGDKGALSDEITDYYSVSGIGHILAVSGLHVGFVVTIVSFILDRLHANRWIKLSTTSVALVFYCFLASFSLSVVRASIMCELGLLAGLFGKQRDPLSSLCFAVTVILAIMPTSLFDVGFEMSASAVFGILLFSKIFTRVFLHILPKKISSTLAVSLSAQIGITPISLVYFYSFPTYSVLINLIIIPLVTIAFIAIVIALIVTLIIPQFGVLLSIAGMPLVIVDDIAIFAYKLPLAELRIFAAGWFLAVFVLYFVCSKFFMMQRLKPLVIIVCIITMSCCVGVMNIPLNSSFDIIAVAEYKSVTTVVRSNGKTFVIGDMVDYSSICDALYTLRVRCVDAVYLNELSKTSADCVLSLNKKYEVKAVYFPLADNADGISTLADGGYTELYSVDTATNKEIVPIYSDSFVGYEYSSNTAKILLLGYGVKVRQAPIDVVNECAIIRSYVYDGNFENRIYLLNYKNSYIDVEPEHCKVIADDIIGFSTATGEIKIL